MRGYVYFFVMARCESHWLYHCCAGERVVTFKWDVHRLIVTGIQAHARLSDTVKAREWLHVFLHNPLKVETTFFLYAHLASLQINDHFAHVCNEHLWN